MLKINYSNIDIEKYYKVIADRKMKKFKNITFEEYYNKYIKHKLNNYNLEDIICGDFSTLLNITKEIGTHYSSKSNIIKQFFNYDKSSSKLKLKTSSFQPEISKFFQESLELHTCYYCNIDFINTFKKDNKTKNAFTLDHVLEKAQYPFLSLSLHNLLPSCSTCNTKVKDSKILFEVSPTNKNFDFDETVKFKTFVINLDLKIEKEQDFYIKLIETYSNKYDKYIEGLNLNNRYDYHKYKVLEMIKKRREYPDTRIKELSNLTNKTVEEVKQDLFGIYLSKNLHKRPLSKLIKDISEELDLI